MSFQHDVVSGEQYRYALTNFRIAHEKVEEQRVQLQEQEKQIALLRARIATLEGGTQGISTKQGTNSVDDFSIKNSASKLERLINRWAADLVRSPKAHLNEIRNAAVSDIFEGYPPDESELYGDTDATPMQIQNLLRHAMSAAISEGIVNCLIVTNSPEANIQLTRIHEHIFARDPTVAAVWRRQTFSAAVDVFTPEMSQLILSEHMPTLSALLNLSPLIDDQSKSSNPAMEVLVHAYEFSRMLHGSPSSSGGTVDAFYRAFVPELSSTLYPRQIELVKRCLTSERGESDRVGATIFPGLVKVSRGPATPANQPDTDNVQTVVRRAQVVCECALGIQSHAPIVS